MSKIEQTEKEEWRPIEGYPCYQISNLGRVKSLRNPKNPKILRPKSNNKGYLLVSITKGDKYGSGDKPITHRIHKLVADAFIENPEGKCHIDHINTITTDNRSCNLRWVTPKENAQNPITHERVAKSNRLQAEQRKQIVLVYNEDLQIQSAFTSTADAGKLGFNQGNISSCCMGVLKRYLGLIWSYTPLTSIEQRTELENSVSDKRSRTKENMRKAFDKYVSKDREVYLQRMRDYYYSHKEDFRRRAKKYAAEKKAAKEKSTTSPTSKKRVLPRTQSGDNRKGEGILPKA